MLGRANPISNWKYDWNRSRRAEPNPALRLRHRHDQADGRQEVPDADALGLGSDLDPVLARVVNLPGQLPALLLRAADGLHQLLHHLLEGMAVAVVENGHPGRRDREIGALDLLDVRSLGRTSGEGRHQLLIPIKVPGPIWNSL